MRDVNVGNFRADPLYPRVVKATARILERGKVVAPVDVLVEMQLLTPEKLLDWRHGRIPYLERCILGSLTRLSRLLRILRFHAHDLNLAPSVTVYKKWGKGAKPLLRFTKTGDPRLEEAYARHFVWPGKGTFHAPGVPAAVPGGHRLRSELAQKGYLVLPRVVPRAQLESVAAGLEAALAGRTTGGIYRRRGVVYAARQLLDVYPRALRLLRTWPLADALKLASRVPLGVVRAQLLDKPPGHGWAIPWHRDMSVALAPGAVPSPRFTRPTVKAGVPHFEAPRDLLERMLAVRIHLDAVTSDNGPMELVPGSHRDGMQPPGPGVTGESVRHDAGDVLLMRPLVLHRSVSCSPGCPLRRRVLHFELAPADALPDGSRWYSWTPIDGL